MHYDPVSIKPLLFVPTAFNEDPSTGIACLDKFIGANTSTGYKVATNIRGRLLHMSADAKCSPSVKSNVQKFDQYCQRLGLLSLEPTSLPQSVDDSSSGYSSAAVEAPDNIEHLLASHEMTKGGSDDDEEDASGDDMGQDTRDAHALEEELPSMDSSESSASDDDDVDAYIDYLYPDTSLHRSQIDLQPLPQVSYATAPVFTNPFASSEEIESFDSFMPTESSSPKKRRNTSPKVASPPRKKARAHHPSASTSTSTSTSSPSFSSSEYEGDDASTNNALSDFPPGHPQSPFSKILCKDGSFKYTCRKCPDFSTRATGDMRRHMESLAHKPQKDHICRFPKCGGSFTRKDALKRHQLSKRHFV